MSTEETKTEQNHSDSMYNENNIPVPQKKDDGTIKIGKLTAEDIFKEMQRKACFCSKKKRRV